MKLERQLQRRVLEALRDCYPEQAEIANLADAEHADLQGNLFYLAEHGLIEKGARREGVSGAPNALITAAITARGLDFLEDDGGLQAILTTVRVQLDAPALQALLEKKIAESALPPAEKKALVERLRALSGRVLGQLAWKAVEMALEKPDAIRALLHVLSGASGGHLPPTALV